MTEEPKLAKALEVLMAILDSEVEKLLAVTRADQLGTPVVDEADSSLDRPTLNERNDAINNARKHLAKAMYHWLELKDIGWRE